MTWVALHKFTIPGDIAAGVYVFMFGILYTVLHNTPAFDDNALFASIYLALTYTLSACITTVAYRLSPWHPLAKYPGPLLAKVSKYWIIRVVRRGELHRTIMDLHRIYGPYVRTGKCSVLINGEYLFKHPERSQRAIHCRRR